jgi:hypothetical protein
VSLIPAIAVNNSTSDKFFTGDNDNEFIAGDNNVGD